MREEAQKERSAQSTSSHLGDSGDSGDTPARADGAPYVCGLGGRDSSAPCARGWRVMLSAGHPKDEVRPLRARMARTTGLVNVLSTDARRIEENVVEPALPVRHQQGQGTALEYP